MQKIQLFTPPFIDCPYCGKRAFGICTIGDDYYTRRCNECWRPQGHEKGELYRLPELSKKVLYLDQFALSNITKVLKGIPFKAVSHTQETWIEVTRRILRLVHAQLLICPSSWAHEEESATSQYYESLRRMALSLAGGVHFLSFDDIRNRQLYSLAAKWLGVLDRHVIIGLKQVIYGEPNAWLERFTIVLPKLFDEEGSERLREDRGTIDEQLQRVYERWQSETSATFEDWFVEENRSFGPHLWQEYMKRIERLMKAQVTNSAVDPLEWLPGILDVLVTSVLELCERAGIQKPDSLGKAQEFFYSNICCQAPCTINESLLWAAFARKLAAGQKRLPTRGTRNDVRTISHLFPYCDAMFVDKECHGLLSEQPLPKRMVGSPLLFSLSNTNKLIEYLSSIEGNTPQSHFDKVREVYGDGWEDPLGSMSKR
jgi:hypothetical protein